MMERKKSILLVDDDKAILTSFRELLMRKGYDADTAGTGRQATDKAIAKVYDLVIIDMKLPDMEGTELLARFHRNYPRPKKIIVTGYPTMQNAIDSVNLQANAYLVKPVNPEEFLRVVDEVIREHSEEQEITKEKVTHWAAGRDRKAREKPQPPSQTRSESGEEETK